MRTWELAAATVAAIALGCGLAQAQGAKPAPSRAPVPAQAQPAPPQPAPQAAPAAAEAPAPGPKPWRTEILNFDNWSVTCQDFREPAARRTCQAQMQVVRQGSQQVILTMIVAGDDKNVYRAAVSTPTGVAIQPGVDLAIGGQTRKIPFESCEPARCTAVVVIDDRLAKDMSSGADMDATVVSNAGQSVKMSFSSKGFDKAWAALAAKP